MTRALLALLAVSLLGTGAGGCGGARESNGAQSHSSSGVSAAGGAVATRPASTASTQLPRKKDDDGDGDSQAGRRYDSDDPAILDFGQAASAAEQWAITTLVKRYYRAAGAADGAAACPLIYSLIAESVTEEYGQPPGSPELHGSTCAVVTSKLFEQHHEELASKAAALHVTRVRVTGDRGLAVLSFGEGSERDIRVHRERGVWKTYTLFDVSLP